MKKILLLKNITLMITFVLVILCSAPGTQAIAASPESLPGGVVKLSVSNESTEYSKMYDKENIIQLLDRTLDINDIDRNSISGDLSIQLLRQDYFVEIGLGAEFTLGMLFPMLEATRESSLKLDVDNAETQAFARKYQSARMKGRGDTQVWLSYRPVYSDDVDYMMALKIDWNDGYADLDDPEKIPLGNGLVDTTAQLRWQYYSRYSTARNVFNFEYTRSEPSTIKGESGDNVSISQGYQWHVQYEISWQLDYWHLGFDVEWDVKASTEIDGKDQDNGYFGLGSNIFLGYGNLKDLEEGTVSLPYTFKVMAGRTFYGKFAPIEEAYGVSASLYF